MEKQRNTQMVVIAILAVAILTMSVGFAAYSASLDIEGNTEVIASSWDIKFVEDSYTESAGSVSVPVANRTITGTSVTYAVSLTQPGDFYEFSLNVLNNGTFNANLTGITMNALTAEQSEYLSYKVIYNGTEYTASTTGLSFALAKEAISPVKIRVEYLQPADPDDLPTTVTIPLTASLTYAQA